MVNTRRHKTPTKTNREHEAKQAVLDKCCFEIDEAVKTNGGRKPYGMVAEMVKDLTPSCPWISRHSINFAWTKYGKNEAATETETPSAGGGAKSIGRPSGSTNDAKYDMKMRREMCLDAVAVEFNERRNVAKREGKYVKKGCLENIIKQQKAKYNLSDEVKVDKEAIRSRYYRGNLHKSSKGPYSPMRLVEPKLVDLIIQMSRIMRCLTVSQCLLLANDLIEGTEVEKAVVEYKKKIKASYSEKANLGPKYWMGFKKRWSHLLTFKRGQKFALDRSAALTFCNINKMYDEVYDAMVECKVASRYDTPIYSTNNGSIATEWSQKFGLPCTHKIDYPEMCLVVDEVGADLSQKGDGHIGGAKYACEKGTHAQNKVQHTDKHFTLLGFTALTGEPVLCLVILAGVQEALSVESGIDPFVAQIYGDASDDYFFDRNYGPGKLYPGGPTCKFQGKEIPCMVRWTPKGSITSAILAEALEHIDSFGVFDRSDGKSPFLLLDGHQSRFELPFLEYITDNKHEWQVCIGVPYGTSLWQVADSKEQNGSYKISLSKAKKEFLEQKLRMFIDPPSLAPTDVIPLVNVAWSASFSRIDKNKKAIAERGWGPCNRNLLLYKEIQNTMTRDDAALLKSMKDTFLSPSNNFAETDKALIDSLSIQQSSSGDGTIISDLTENGPNLSQKIVSLNYSSGNSAMVLETLVAAQDLHEARERNKRNKERGGKVAETHQKAKAVTAIYFFNQFGCKVGKTALQKKRELFDIQQQKVLAARKKEEQAYAEKQRKYDEVMSLSVDDDNKLTGAQLRALLNMKKRKTDSPISSLRKKDMLLLWKEWKARPSEGPEYTHELVESVNEATQASTISAHETLASTEDGGVIVSI